MSSDGAIGRLMEPVVEPTALLGQWQLARQVRDERAGLSGTASGQLTLSAENDQIAWREEGTLLWNGSRLPFSRTYRLRRDDGWWLYFPDGRPFHVWSPGQWVHHPCSEDSYYGLVTVTGLEAWNTQWDVRGPTTAQRITTRLTRQPGRRWLAVKRDGPIYWTAPVIPHRLAIR